jgi:hypothetical protein
VPASTARRETSPVCSTLAWPGIRPRPLCGDVLMVDLNRFQI